MNANITQFLFTYMDNPDPRYAVMLKGKWGCGKSFFIQNWIELYKEKIKDGDAVLDPIYVSLYGLSSTSQITSAIDRVLHPFLYSKGVEITKKILKIAGRIAFRASLDWNDDGKEDVSMDATLDSLSLLASRDDNASLGPKLIVFDDLERCLIDMKLLLGYINNFVEHGACHVVIVGDETHTTDDTKAKLLEFKEKTVGREFEVMPDMGAALDYFIDNDVPLTEWLKSKKVFILDCFQSTKCNNLRLLRQCLYDFSVLYNETDEHLLKDGDVFMTAVLGSYVVVYCEYRGENRDLLKEWDWSYFHGLSGDETTKERISNLQNKYSFIANKYRIEVLDSSHVKKIIHEIETGQSLKAYVEISLNQLQGKVSLQDKLAEFVNLSNEEFEQAYNELVCEINTGKSPNLYVLGRSLALLVFFNYKMIHTIAGDTVSHAKDMIAHFYASIDNKEDLYKARNAFYQGISSYGRFYDYPLGKAISDFATEKFEQRNNELKNKMEEALLIINNDNVSRLIELSSESTPDHSCDYRMTSIFKNIDAETFCERILKLNNKSIREICQFFSLHYEFYCSLGNGCNHYAEDLPILQLMKEKLESEVPNRNGVDGYMFRNLIKYIDGAIRRANGDNNPITISED
jgi:Cdc6-like AAA superfamily ATPase